MKIGITLNNLLIIILLLNFTLLSKAKAITFEKITSKEGLSNNTIFSIIQDNDGFMWFGSREGLNRYDGSELITFYANANDTTSIFGDRINCLEIKEDGNLLIGTSVGLNIYQKDNNTFKSIKFNNRNVGSVADICAFNNNNSFLFITNKGVFIHKDDTCQILFKHPGCKKVVPYKKGILLIITNTSLFMINDYGEILNEYQNINNEISFKYNLSDIYIDKENNIWLGTLKQGLLLFDITNNKAKIITSKIKHKSLDTEIIRCIEEDANGNLWLGTESGIFIYNIKNESLMHIGYSSVQKPGTLNDKAIYVIYRSRENIVWIGTYFGGINYAIPSSQKFKTIIPNTKQTESLGKAVSQIIEDKHHNIWFATEDKGITIWDRDKGSFRSIIHTKNNKGLSSNNIHAILEDKNDIYWIGTFLGGLNKYNSRTNKIRYYRPDKNDTASISNNSIYCIAKDQKNTLWIGTQGGLNILDEQTGTFSQYRKDIFKNKFIYDIQVDSNGEIWFAIMGSDELFRLNLNDDNITRYTYSDQTTNVQKPGIISICEDSQNNIWVGTLNNGLLKLNKNSGSFDFFDTRNGLPNNTIYGIVEHKGFLWLSTNKGIVKFNMETHEVRNYNFSHNLSHNQFNFRSYFIDSKNYIYFGSIYGITYFHPDSLETNSTLPIPYLDNLKLFNKKIIPSDKGVLQKQIKNTDHFNLRYNQNVISFEFSSIDFLSKGSNTYAYKLKGFDTEWNEIKSQKSTTYTNLPHGNYTFQVKASNNDNVWSDKIASVNLTIKPPFYLTKYAMFLYFTIFIGLLLLYNMLVKFRNKEKAAIALERIEKEKIKELNQHKLNFFTNISHELKTPLTLIIANIDKVLNGINIDSQENKPLFIIKKHASRLHLLIEQLMEFRKAESSHLDLQLKNGDIILFLRDTFNAFIPLYNQKSINYKFTTNTDNYICFFDADKLEKISTNLLSNSVKNCDDLDRISLNVFIIEENNQKCMLKMHFNDSGQGIPAPIIDKVFEPFFRNEKQNQVLSGTGIGLSYVKTLTNFLKGNITLQSKEGEGTQITVSIPLEKNITIADDAEYINGNKNLNINNNIILDETTLELSNDNRAINDTKWKILIVEDNKDLLQFLRDHFSHDYEVIYAENGKLGLEKAQKQLPDLILSDIIMPEMDGIELCKTIKEDINTSHIPVILLTAKANTNNKLEALQYGADLYLPKPFNLKEVDILVKNLIESRKKLKEHFISEGNIEDIENNLNNKDQDFISRLTKIVIENIENPEFDVSTFTKEAGISRSLLHLKLKKIVNLSTSEFVKTIKINKATELLIKTDLTVSEIAYKLGFTDASYFGRVFKEIKKMSPSAFRNQG